MSMIIFYEHPEWFLDKASAKKVITTKEIHFFQALIFCNAGVGGGGGGNDNSV